ncbi:dioxygenase family protein [Zavarzinella formosa]|uniref:dioxygenase family protein n=1 Tax=Zavarzinella formosa TaxID=360055 RepID=UPI0002E6B3A7|nr:protocatechuate 3,4-dioxygenase [Zavarzinella formosa]
MNDMRFVPSRRLFLGSAGATALSLFTVPGAFAEALTRTPKQTEGPFYPDKLPLDTDNDLLIINDSITPGVGEITHLTGKVLDLDGKPLGNSVVEIWQCDNGGAYRHSKTDNANTKDKNFQGFGRFTTNKDGEYYFRTIKPVAYPGRSPHIHFKIKRGGKEALTTQLYIKGEQRNEKDFIYMGVKDEKGRAALCADFAPIKESKTGELAANFNIVLGITPESR